MAVREINSMNHAAITRAMLRCLKNLAIGSHKWSRDFRLFFWKTIPYGSNKYELC